MTNIIKRLNDRLLEETGESMNTIQQPSCQFCVLREELGAKLCAAKRPPGFTPGDRLECNEMLQFCSLGQFELPYLLGFGLDDAPAPPSELPETVSFEEWIGLADKLVRTSSFGSTYELRTRALENLIRKSEARSGNDAP